MKGINWLIEVLNNVRPYEFCSIEKVKELCYQAKEMEKQERMYSEEEVRMMLSESFNASIEGYDITADEIIEQFKNK